MDDKEFERLLLSVQKPGRYSGGEINSVVKDKNKVDVRFAFCFPDTYEIGMSHGTLTRKLASRYSISALRNSYGKEDLMNIALSRRETPSRSPIFQAKCLKEGELIFASFVEWIG